MDKFIMTAYLLWFYYVLSILYKGYTPSREPVKVKAKYQENYRGADIRLPLGYEYSRQYRG